MADNVLRILYLAAEVEPFAKTGGLAEVAGSLPKAIRTLGHDIHVIMPLYGHVDPEAWGLHLCLPAFPVPHGRSEVQAQLYQGLLPDSDVPIWFVDNSDFFGSPDIYLGDQDADRFIFWARAALEAVRLLDWRPDIIHCNDWHSAIVPNWLRTSYRRNPFFKSTATVYTIHTLAYRGVFGQRVLEIAGVAEYGFIAHPDLPHIHRVVDLMSRGIYYANIINTVSPSHAHEILTPEFGEGLDSLLQDRRDRLFGVLNGIDYARYNPASDVFLDSHFSVDTLEAKSTNKRFLQSYVDLPIEPDLPLWCYIGRINQQKGVGLLIEALDMLLCHHKVQVVVVGTGEQEYHDQLQHLHDRYPDHVRVQFTFSEELHHYCYAGSDVLLMPSLVEPCGINQLIALRYGTLPLVHAVGGLNDTVIDIDVYHQYGTGFIFDDPQVQSLYGTMLRTLEVYKQPTLWQAAMQRAMLQDWSWQRSAMLYDDLYRRALASQSIQRPRSIYRSITISDKE